MNFYKFEAEDGHSNLFNFVLASNYLKLTEK